MTLGLRRPASTPLVGARHAVPVRPSRHKRPPTASLSPLEATLTKIAVTTVNKGLAEIVSPLNAMFTRNRGGAFDTRHSRTTHP